MFALYKGHFFYAPDFHIPFEWTQDREYMQAFFSCKVNFKRPETGPELKKGTKQAVNIAALNEMKTLVS